ncbi:MAG: hypothetical protein A2252_10430 [Elusimicrobia bacterium RIFOXYA2_FULL_39_19]|nr:MAG: hypothetical protein A2252_10430 [Elusimicrobia bacterium RIFOXYA2_FULL_39_19]
MKKILLSLFIIYGLTTSAFSQQNNEVFVSKAEFYTSNNCGYVNIIFNDLVTVNEILIKSINGKKVPEFPRYINNSGKIYEQVKVVNRKLYESIVKILETETPVSINSGYKEINYEITKFSILKKSKSSLKAFAEVTFDGSLSVECKVFEGKNGSWISWPARKEGNSWVKLVFLRKKYKEKIEKILLKRYADIKSEAYNGWE